jgi:hypothetical protein
MRRVQELGPKYARNVKVSMDEMRRKQFAAARLVMRHQQHFLAEGKFLESSQEDANLAPIGSLELGLDEVGLKARNSPTTLCCAV